MIMTDEALTNINRDAPSWPLGKPHGRNTIAPTPDSPEIRALLEQNYCSSVVVGSHYEVINKRGDAVELPFGTSFEDWRGAVHALVAYDL